jgi:hypothetical protein
MLVRLGLHQTATPDHKRLSLDLVALVLQWEARTGASGGGAEKEPAVKRARAEAGSSGGAGAPASADAAGEAAGEAIAGANSDEPPAKLQRTDGAADTSAGAAAAASAAPAAAPGTPAADGASAAATAASSAAAAGARPHMPCTPPRILPCRFKQPNNQTRNSRPANPNAPPTSSWYHPAGPPSSDDPAGPYRLSISLQDGIINFLFRMVLILSDAKDEEMALQHAFASRLIAGAFRSPARRVVVVITCGGMQKDGPPWCWPPPTNQFEQPT